MITDLTHRELRLRRGEIVSLTREAFEGSVIKEKDNESDKKNENITDPSGRDSDHERKTLFLFKALTSW